ncbi:hypothetical protein LPJ61_001201 [Coemansia biformis]|uniref:WD40 repeat-like protein n=1 Tax=Coemansia biformis TaxID=1286918 RepID=A0A9W7YGF3_9FUNG|nr:hypothetical protein LPJ61_001201 [Coemansia biformis]
MNLRRTRGRPRSQDDAGGAGPGSEPGSAETPATQRRGRPRADTSTPADGGPETSKAEDVPEPGPAGAPTRLDFSSPRSSRRRATRTADVSGDDSDGFVPAGDDSEDSNFVADVAGEDSSDDAGAVSAVDSDEPVTEPRAKRARTAAAAVPVALGAKARKPGQWREWTPKMARMASLWLGPPRGELQINPSYIDVGLEESAWAALREMHVDLGHVDIETSRPALCQHMPPGALHSDEERQAADDEVYVALADDDGVAQGEGQSLHIRPLHARRLAGQTPGWIANAAELVTSIDWAPVHPEDTGTASVDYIAVGGQGPGSAVTGAVGPMVGKRTRNPAPGHIQVWRLGAEHKSQASDLRLDMTILHNYGRCVALRWCPISVPRSRPRRSDSAPQVPAIGVLAAIFGDGVLRVCAVPDADALRQQQRAGASSTSNERLLHDASVDPVCIRWPHRSIAEMRAEQGVFTAVEWASSDLVVAGTSKGVLNAWHVGSAVRAHDGPAPVPMVSQQLHAGHIMAIGVYRGGAAPDRPFNSGRTASGFRQVSLADIQIASLGVDGRLRQTSLLFPTRLGVPLQSLSRATPALCTYWPLGTCVFSDVDKSLRQLNNRILAEPGDPWLRAMATPGEHNHAACDSGAASDEPAKWNQCFDRSARLIAPLECPTLQAAASDLHTYVAVAKSSGELFIGNVLHGDVARTFVSQYRTIHTLLSDGDSSSGGGGGGGPGARRFVYRGRQPPRPRPKGDKRPSAQYHLYLPDVAVRACAWSRNPHTSTWIASAAASGIIRIEDVAP